jgi:hypothetical protein
MKSYNADSNDIYILYDKSFLRKVMIPIWKQKFILET